MQSVDKYNNFRENISYDYFMLMSCMIRMVLHDYVGETLLWSYDTKKQILTKIPAIMWNFENITPYTYLDQYALYIYILFDIATYLFLYKIRLILLLYFSSLKWYFQYSSL